MSNSETFKELAERKGYTPYSLANESGVSENTARELWDGKTRKRRAFSVKKKLAKTLGVSVETVQASIRKTREDSDQ